MHTERDKHTHTERDTHMRETHTVKERTHNIQRHTHTKPYKGMSYLKQIMLGKMSEETLSYAQRKKYKD